MGSMREKLHTGERDKEYYFKDRRIQVEQG
jgi:hypothetical protein